MGDGPDRDALAWQVGVWDRMSDTYRREIDRRFASVVENVVARAGLRPGQRVLDLGTGTGAVAERAAALVGPGGEVLGVDISASMLAQARRRLAARGLGGVVLCEGRAEALPAPDGGFDAVLASLSLMYVLDRPAAAREIARVLRPGGRLVAAAWAGPEQCDIVRFQQIAGRYAPTPPVPGVGPGALADPAPFLARLAEAGIAARVETELLGFDFPDFASAWEVLAGVTAADLAPERQREARAAVRAAMYPAGDSPRRFQNLTQFIVGQAGPAPA
ncbi:MAG TPA: methyltransferase domain-containing protein [Chloroflexota bacterium]